MDKFTNIGFRLDRELKEKLKYVAGYEGRSMNGQMIWFICHYLAEFEKANGKITFEDDA